MSELKGREFKEFFNSLTDEQLELRVLFDTEGREYDYHMASVAAITCEDDIDAYGKELVHIGLHEFVDNEMSAIKISRAFLNLQKQNEILLKAVEALTESDMYFYAEEALEKIEQLNKGEK